MPSIPHSEILFIINPHSGKRKTASIVRQIKAIEPPVSYVVTQSLREVQATFEGNIEKYKVFIVVGGDGTVNEALPYLIGRADKILALLPAGSGNGFAREMGFKYNVNALLEEARRGDSTCIDVLVANGKNYINVAGVGLDSFVAHQFQHSSKRGLRSYVLFTLRSMFRFRPFQAVVCADGQTFSGRFLMIAIANTRQFGNNAIISPRSKPNDGAFELVLVHPFPQYLYPEFVLKTFLGRLRESKFLTFLRVEDRVNIESGFQLYHIDGEPGIFDKHLSVSLSTHKLRVLKTRWCRF